VGALGAVTLCWQLSLVTICHLATMPSLCSSRLHATPCSPPAQSSCKWVNSIKSPGKDCKKVRRAGCTEADIAESETMSGAPPGGATAAGEGTPNEPRRCVPISMHPCTLTIPAPQLHAWITLSLPATLPPSQHIMPITTHRCPSLHVDHAPTPPRSKR
jgi:hypothetical protein